MKAASALVRYGKKMKASGLTTGSGGNLSMRTEEGVWITPSAMDYEEMEEADILLTDLSGKILKGAGKPSSELGFHLALYRKRPDIHAVVHTHSPSATTLACLGWPLPAVHYLVAWSGKKEVPIAPYATFGTEELACIVAENLKDGYALLLANHGLVTLGGTLDAAFSVAEEIEFVAGIYLGAKSVGEPVILDDEAMEKALERFKDYRGDSLHFVSGSRG